MPDGEKNKKIPAPFKNKEDYIGDTNEKICGSYDYKNETDGYVSNLGEEHENGEDGEFSEKTPEINASIKSKMSKIITEEDVIIYLLTKKNSLKAIQSVISSIDTYEQDIL